MAASKAKSSFSKTNTTYLKLCQLFQSLIDISRCSGAVMNQR